MTAAPLSPSIRIGKSKLTTTARTIILSAETTTSYSTLYLSTLLASINLIDTAEWKNDFMPDTLQVKNESTNNSIFLHK